MERDLEADLRLCNEATPGPWEIGNPDTLRPNETPLWADGFPLAAFYSYTRGGVIETSSNASFASAAREGWPAAIRLALERGRLLAEKNAEIARLRDMLEPFLATYSVTGDELRKGK